MEQSIAGNHTVEEITSWIEENKKELLKSFKKDPEIPEFLKGPGNHFENVWYVGCWLNMKLKEINAPENMIHEIGFAHGQRSLFGDTFEWAIKYLNEFENSGAVKEKPGIELAEKIIKEDCSPECMKGENNEES